MDYEMEVCTASRQQLIFIAKKLCVWRWKNNQNKQECPVGGVGRLAM